jgi:hypothetical protein
MTQSNNSHPSAEIIQKWRKEAPVCRDGGVSREIYIARQAADWQLDRCCEELRLMEGDSACDELRAICRPKPKPPSLKEQALKALGSKTKVGESRVIEHFDHETIRCALESLQDD